MEREEHLLLKAQSFRVENTFEHQTLSKRTETAMPLAFEYGITDKLELSTENPVAPEAAGFVYIG